MKTSVWGKHAWEFLHACSMEYPENPSPDDKLAARALFRSLTKMLPCDDCCRHYCQEIRESPVEDHLSSREELVDWVLQLHNRVNSRLGKAPITKQQLLVKYEDAGCNVDNFPLRSTAPSKDVEESKGDGMSTAAKIGVGIAATGICAYVLYKALKRED